MENSECLLLQLAATSVTVRDARAVVVQLDCTFWNKPQ